MNLASLFKGTIMPKIALTALVKNLESEVKHPIDFFRLIYIKESNDMYFEVRQPDNSLKKYSYGSKEQLIKQIEMLSKGSMSTASILDVVTLTYTKNSEKEFLIDAYYRNEQGEKLTNQFTV